MLGCEDAGTLGIDDLHSVRPWQFHEARDLLLNARKSGHWGRIRGALVAIVDQILAITIVIAEEVLVELHIAHFLKLDAWKLVKNPL